MELKRPVEFLLSLADIAAVLILKTIWIMPLNLLRQQAITGARYLRGGIDIFS
jgi:hypothetical protein